MWNPKHVRKRGALYLVTAVTVQGWAEFEYAGTTIKIPDLIREFFPGPSSTLWKSVTSVLKSQKFDFIKKKLEIGREIGWSYYHRLTKRSQY